MTKQEEQKVGEYFIGDTVYQLTEYSAVIMKSVVTGKRTSKKDVVYWLDGDSNEYSCLNGDTFYPSLESVKEAILRRISELKS